MFTKSASRSANLRAFKAIKVSRIGRVHPLTPCRAASLQSAGSQTSRLPSIFASLALITTGISLGAFLVTYSNTENPPKGVFPLTSTSPLSDLTPAKYANSAQLLLAFEEIQQVIGKQNTTNAPPEKDAHSDTYWTSHHAKPNERPGLVVFPGSTEEVSKIAKICHKYHVPIIAFGGGTSLEGHFTPIYGGVCIDFKRMDKILAVHKDDLDVVVQPAVGWEDLNEYLEEQDLFFGPDPGPGAQIGGMIGTSCSGTNAARYGTMRENVLNLTVVLADGTIIKTRQRPRKSSAGYNLTGLFIGSEGTLGLVTEATLKLFPKPQNENVAVVTFGSISDAAKVVQEIVQLGIQVGAVELLDDKMMAAINTVGSTSKVWKEKPTLFFKFSGTKVGVADQIKQVEKLSKAQGAQSFEFAKNEEEKLELWSARKHALWSTIDSAPQGYQTWTTDVAVPVSRLADVISDTKDDIEQSKVLGTVVGHVGDGNFHAILVFPESDREIVSGVVHRMVKRALEAEGTCTGEHGVGVGKKDYLEEELGLPALDTMRRLKKALDPLLLLNSDKVITVNPSLASH